MITFVGAGNMARAIIMGMMDDSTFSTITVTNRTKEKLTFFAERGLVVMQDNVKGVKNADVVVLAVKPKDVAEVCVEIAPALKSNALIISVAAGITTDFIQKKLGTKHAIIRAMPNTGSEVQAGVTGIFANEFATDEHVECAEDLFASIGLVVTLDDEQQIPIVTATSGSGIAYFFKFMEIMQQKAVDLGLPEDVVRLMVAQTALGAAKLTLESDESIATLCDHVVSPNGTTQKALDTMMAAGLEAAIQNGMSAAITRSKELTETLCDS